VALTDYHSSSIRQLHSQMEKQQVGMAVFRRNNNDYILQIIKYNQGFKGGRVLEIADNLSHLRYEQLEEEMARSWE